MTTPAEPPTVRTTCAIVGGGPAGLVLGLLLARAGVAVTVLEKHADFLRDTGTTNVRDTGPPTWTTPPTRVAETSFRRF